MQRLLFAAAAVSDSRTDYGAAASHNPQPSQLNAACAIPDSANEHTMKITTPTPATTSLAQHILVLLLLEDIPFSF
jgi:hypothetical protein